MVKFILRYFILFDGILNGIVFLLSLSYNLLRVYRKAVCVCVCVCMHAQLLNHVHLFVTLWTVAHQALLSMGFFRQEYWSGLPFSSSGDLLNQGSNLCLLHWQADSLPLSHLGSPEK